MLAFEIKSCALLSILVYCCQGESKMAPIRIAIRNKKTGVIFAEKNRKKEKQKANNPKSAEFVESEEEDVKEDGEKAQEKEAKVQGSDLSEEGVKEEIDAGNETEEGSGDEGQEGNDGWSGENVESEEEGEQLKEEHEESQETEDEK